MCHSTAWVLLPPSHPLARPAKEEPPRSGLAPSICGRLLFSLPQRVQLSGNKGHQGIKDDIGKGQGG